MMHRLARLTWRLQRFELAAVVAISVSLSIAGTAIALALRQFGGSACAAGLATCGTDEVFGFVNTALAGPFMATMTILPFAAGTILGVSIVGAEVDRETAALAWYLAPSRLRWLVWRAVPAALVLAVSMTLVGLVAEVVEAARAPLFDPAASFLDYGLRGPLLVARSLAAFAVALLAGAISGRVLSGVIGASVALVLLVGVLGAAMVYWLPVEEVASGHCAQTCIASTDALRTLDGRFLTFVEAARQAPTGPPPRGGPQSEPMRAWMDANRYTEVTVAITGERMPQIALRELFVLLGTAAVSSVAAVAVTARRRVN